MNPDFLKKLQEITAALRGGLVFNPLDELQKRAQQTGEDFGLQLEKNRAQAGYADAHPESMRAQQERMNNAAMLALQFGKGEKPALTAAIRTPDGYKTGYTHAEAVINAGLDGSKIHPRDEGFVDANNKWYSRQQVEKLMDRFMSQPVKNQIAAREEQAGRKMGVTSEDLRGKLYANRGTKAAPPITGRGTDMSREEQLAAAKARQQKIWDSLDSLPNFAERVMSAAIKTPKGEIVQAPTHAEAYRAAGIEAPDITFHDKNSGFLTNKNRFIDRKEAYAIASKSGAVDQWATPSGLAAEEFTPDAHLVNGDALFNDLHTKGGFTYDPQTWQPITSGYSVGGGNEKGLLYKKPIAEATPDDIAAWLKENEDKIPPDMTLGGWVNNGHVYIEPADQIADLNEAQRLGNERGEKAIWDHANKTEIPLKAAKAEAAATKAEDIKDVLNRWRTAWDGFQQTGNEIKDFAEVRRRALADALRNPSTPEAPWLAKYVQHDIERPNGQSPDKIAQVQAIADKTFNSKQFRKWLEAGQGTGNWYDTRATQSRAIDALGDKLGPEAFNQFIDHVAASTARSRPENNIRRASWWRALNLQGLLNPDELRSSTLAAPEGMGHIAQRTHHFATADLLEQGKVNAMTNPKPASFAENLKMNWKPVTFDTRMATRSLAANPKMEAGIAGTPEDATPRKWAYAPIEKAAQDAAAAAAKRGDIEVPAGLDPAAYWQAQVWGGIGRTDANRMTSVDNPSFHDILDKLLSRSADLWGVSPSKANELFWKGQPLDLPLDAGLLTGKARSRKK